MDFSTYPWMDGSFSVGDPTTSYLDPALMGQQPNIYAPASNPYADASPLSGGMPPGVWAALLSNPQLMQGLGALAGVGAQRGTQQMPMRPPEPPSAPGRQYMAQFMNVPFYTVQHGFNGGRR